MSGHRLAAYVERRGPAEPALRVEWACELAVGVPDQHSELWPAAIPRFALQSGQRRPAGTEAADATRDVRADGVFIGDRLIGLLALRVHPSMVAHRGRCALIVVQFDTQQLP